ncbi:DNA recombination protein RmuC [Candidatus Saccharibacteria bacterium]|nr:DNA recombination protein RmuC [Candidatus Saccharibacteria bacterium]
MDILVIVLCSINVLVMLATIYFVVAKKKDGNSRELEETQKEVQRLYDKLVSIEGSVDKIVPKIDNEFRENRKEISDNLKGIQDSNEKKLEQMRGTVDAKLKGLQDSNEKKLEQMRETVDEKLKESVEKRFNESFKSISAQLTQVYQGLGEMRNLATGVGNLRKVMEGVKTRGVYGEVQLGAIIHDSLNTAQYEENIATKRKSNNRVEFAIKMPGKNDEIVYLPIDSKFPIENYSRLLAAYDAGDKALIEKFQKELALDVKTQAKLISTKYLDPPMTTEFGMMFVPTESLYAEILRIPGLSDEIRQKYNIVITSPSTLPVVLSGLIMGFRTMSIEKKSAEVWKVLGEVKAQFGKFGDLLDGVQKKLQESANKIETAKVASRQIERRLKNVDALPEGGSEKLLLE